MSQPTIEYRMKPQGPVLEAYMRSRERVSFIMGPLGSGKTYQSCQKLFSLICEQAPNQSGRRKSRFLAIRNTYPDLTSTTIKDWLELYEPLGKYVGGGMEPPTHHLQFMLEDQTIVEAQVVFLALDRPDAVKKLRGTQVTGFWLNEVKELNKQVVDMCDLRHGRYPSAMDGGPTWHGMIGDTNAPDNDHWYYKLAEEEKPDGWEFWRQPGGVIEDGIDHNGRKKWKANPLAENINNLPDGYYTRGVAGKSDDWISVNLANLYGFVSDGKPVYPEYIDAVHCREFDLIPGLPLYMGVDFGRTPAALIGQRTLGGQWRWRYEIVTEDMGAVEFSKVVRRFIAERLPEFEFAKFSGDPSGDNRSQSDDNTPILIMRANGIPISGTSTNDPTIRREAVAGALLRMIDGEPGLLIHPDCKMTRKGMAGGFSFARVQVLGDERYKDEPVKNMYSHVCEAGQYMMLGGGEGKIVIGRKRSGARPAQAQTDYSIFG